MNTIKKIIAILNVIRFIYIFPLLCLISNRNEIFEDINVAMKHRGYGKVNVYIGFFYLMTFDIYFRALFYKRIGHFSYLVKIFAPPPSHFIIGTYTPIGKGMLCIHPFSTVVNAQSIGRNFSVKNNVTIGEDNGRPIIGDNVTINVNSVVVGPITVGNNVTIGACTLIRKNVPDNSVVVGNPAIIIKKNGIRIKELL